MFRRPSSGVLIRAALTPMAGRLGVDYDESFVTPPRTESAVALDVFRSACNLFVVLAEPDGWIGASRKDARRVAKQVRAGLSEAGARDGVSFMAQNHCWATAEFWLRAAAKPENAEVAEQLRLSADEMGALAELAAKSWPVSDELGVLEEIDHAWRNPVYDRDNPEAMIDLRWYGDRVRATCGAAALTLGKHFANVSPIVVRPIYTLGHVDRSGVAATG